MENDNQTALQRSIQRKKGRVSVLKTEQRFVHTRTKEYWDYEREKVFLENEITEDEKLLEVEKEQLMDAFSTRIAWAKHEDEDLSRNCAEYEYNQKYGTDGK